MGSARISTTNEPTWVPYKNLQKIGREAHSRQPGLGENERNVLLRISDLQRLTASRGERLSMNPVSSSRCSSVSTSLVDLRLQSTRGRPNRPATASLREDIAKAGGGRQLLQKHSKGMISASSSVMRLGVCLALVLGMFWTGQAASAEPREQPPRAKNPVVIRLNGMITPLTERSIERRLQIAERRGADLVIMEINSNGGAAEASFEIAERLAIIAWAHTVAYIPEKALSGAAIVALGCDEILMDSGARIGDAGAIVVDIEQGVFQKVPEKALSDLLARLRTLAQEKDHPVALAEAMMDLDLVVFKVRERDDPEVIHYWTQDQIDNNGGEERWEKVFRVSETDRKYFTVGGERAKELGVAEETVRDFKELTQRYGIVGPVPVLEPSSFDVLELILNNWVVTTLLFAVGVVCLYLELQAAGIGIFAVLSMVCFGLFFWGKFLSGTADTLEIVLFLLGLACIALEIFVIPGFGVAGFAGLGLLFISIILAFSKGWVPTNSEMPDVAGGFGAMIVAGIVSIALIWVLSRHLGSLPIFNRIMLQPPAAETTADSDRGDALTPLGELVGQEGTAKGALRPAGKALIDDQYVDVVAEDGYLEHGASLRVVAVEGRRVIVRRT